MGVGVGWRRRCKTCQSLRELDNQGTVSFFILAVTGMVIDIDHVVRGGEAELLTRGIIASRSVDTVRHTQGSYIAIPIAVSEVATPENKVTHWRCHP